MATMTLVMSSPVAGGAPKDEETLAAALLTQADIVAAVYESVPADLRGAATHQVIVQLNKLLADERVRFSAGAAGPSTMVELIARQ